jgi:2,3-bisphosphoglycerate-dependent phosphoglycerate mutase
MMMGTTRIIAVRHGETAWNVATRIQGHTDIGLNDTGRWQAQRLALVLAGEAIARIYTSDLSRAQDTAHAIAAAGASLGARAVHQHTGLRERGFGIFEGQTHAQIAAQWPEENTRWKHREPHFAPPGGETPMQLHERVSRTLHELAQPHQDEQIVLVTHGGVLDMLYRLATNQAVDAPRTWELGNASINRLLWTLDALTLVGWADARHLESVTLDESST